MGAAAGMTWKKGGCHCGAVTFEVLAPDDVEVDDCNCSICSKTGKHLFCSVCGIKSFYVPRSHPDGYSVNFRCLDAKDFRDVHITPFDGEHWEQHAAELKPLEAN